MPHDPRVAAPEFHGRYRAEEVPLPDAFLPVYPFDNGLSLGEHGLFGKQNLYEFGGMHVPLVLAGPGIPRGKSE
ncbi:MAG: hypothetical protein RLZZ244_271, partial [Verrucomicrobiota bacterium]